MNRKQGDGSPVSLQTLTFEKRKSFDAQLKKWIAFKFIFCKYNSVYGKKALYTRNAKNLVYNAFCYLETQGRCDCLYLVL